MVANVTGIRFLRSMELVIIVLCRPVQWTTREPDRQEGPWN